MKLSVSVLIPCYNVEHTVERVVRGAYRAGQTITQDLEILVINDASRDLTGAKLKKLQKTIPVLRVITHAGNQGYGKTIKELYLTAGKSLLFSLPGDDQFDAEEIHKLLPHLKNADMILGWRTERHDPSGRLVQSRLYNWILNSVFSLNLHDVNTIRLMKKTVIQSVRLKSDSAFVDAELAIRARKKGFRIKEVPVVHKKRFESGATGGKFMKTILPTIIDIIRLQFSMF
jgi:glycosyltransferase involved in cell wall biosynthesis